MPSKPPRGVPIPPRPRQDRRDSGGTAAVWGKTVPCALKNPTGRPYPSAAQAGPEGLGCSRRCVGVDSAVCPQNIHGASLSLRGPGGTGGTRLKPPLCGGGQFRVPSIPHGASLSLRGPGKTGGTRVYPPLCGARQCRVPSIPHGAFLSLRSPGRTGGTRV